jgi:N-dimethylarginine dimethylaminohydrolase
MVAPLKRVLVRRPATAGDWEGAGWRVPDPALLQSQHERFVELLAGLGPEVEIAGALADQVDAVYMHDPLIMSARGGIPLNMAKPVRQKEPRHAAEELERLDIPVVGTLDGDAYADGGDRFWLDGHTIALGLGYRTNRKGAQRLQELLQPEGVHVEAYDMPHDQGPAYVLHLQSFLSAVTEDLYVVYEPLAPVRLLQDLKERGIGWIAIDHDSYMAMGCNIRRPARRGRDGRAGPGRPRGAREARDRGPRLRRLRALAQGRRRPDLPDRAAPARVSTTLARSGAGVAHRGG